MDTDLANQAHEIATPEKGNRFVEKFMNLSGVYAVRKACLLIDRGRKGLETEACCFYER